MDVVLKARGVEITDRIRATAEHKAAKLQRLDRRVTRVEIELISERNPSLDHSHRVEVACQTSRRTLRAEASGADVDAALDQVLKRLERQLTTHRGKLRDRLTRRRDRLQSTRTSSEEPPSSE